MSLVLLKRFSVLRLSLKAPFAHILTCTQLMAKRLELLQSQVDERDAVIAELEGQLATLEQALVDAEIAFFVVQIPALMES